MNSKLLIAAAVGAVTAFFLGFLIFGLAMQGFYNSNMIPYEGLIIDPPRLWAIFIANLATAFLYAYIFDKWANIRTFGAGFSAGIIIGFLFTVSMDLLMYAMMNLYTGMFLVVDVLVSTLYSAVVAGTVASMLGRGSKPAAA